MADSVDLVASLGGEVITYLPAGGTALSFKAIVHREPTEPEQAGGYQYRVNELTVEFPRDAVNGVLTVQEGKDRMTFKRHLSDAEARDWVVVKIESEDAGLTSSDGGLFRVLVEGA